MALRGNKGYVITDAIHVGKTEFVLGKLDGKIPMYMTWVCKDGDSCYWGHYFSYLMDAKIHANDKIIIVKKMESGYYHTDKYSHDRAQAIVDEHSAQLNVTKAQVAAMLTGSMLGWYIPAAAPKEYDEQGQLIKSKRHDRGMPGKGSPVNQYLKTASRTPGAVFRSRSDDNR